MYKLIFISILVCILFIGLDCSKTIEYCLPEHTEEYDIVSVSIYNPVSSQTDDEPLVTSSGYIISYSYYH
jgi:hypothetical protein